MASHKAKLTICAASLLMLGLAAPAGAADSKGASATIHLRGHVPLNCKLNFSTLVVPANDAGRHFLGDVDEYCNTNSYRILVRFDPAALSGTRLSLGTDAVNLGLSGEETITAGAEPTARTRPMAIELARTLNQSTSIRLLIEAHI